MKKFTLLIITTVLMANFCFAQTQKAYIIPCEPVSLDETNCIISSGVYFVHEILETKGNNQFQGSGTENRQNYGNSTNNTGQEADAKGDRTASGNQGVSTGKGEKRYETGFLHFTDRMTGNSITRTAINETAAMGSQTSSSNSMTSTSERKITRYEGKYLRCTLKLRNSLDSDIELRNVRFVLRTNNDKRIGEVAGKDCYLSFGEELEYEFQFPLEDRSINELVEETGVKNIKIVFHPATQMNVAMEGANGQVDIHRSIIIGRNYPKWRFTLDTSGLGTQLKQSWYIPEGANLKQAFDAAVFYNARLQGRSYKPSQMEDFYFEKDGKIFDANDLEKTLPDDMSEVVCRQLLNRTVTVELKMPGGRIPANSFGIDDDSLNPSIEMVRFGIHSSHTHVKISFPFKGDKPIRITCSHPVRCLGIIYLNDNVVDRDPHLFLWEDNPRQQNRIIATLDTSSNTKFVVNGATQSANNGKNAEMIADKYFDIEWYHNVAQNYIEKYNNTNEMDRGNESIDERDYVMIENKYYAPKDLVKANKKVDQYSEETHGNYDIYGAFVAYNSAVRLFKEIKLSGSHDPIASFLNEFGANLYYQRGHLCFHHPKLTISNQELFKYACARSDMLDAINLYQKVMDYKNGKEDEMIKKDFAEVYGCLGDICMTLSHGQFYNYKYVVGVDPLDYKTKEQWLKETADAYLRAVRLDNNNPDWQKKYGNAL